MIPLIDAYLRELLQDKITFLRDNPLVIPQIFGTLGTRTTLKSFTDFILKKDIKVLIGFPRESQQLPCYVITIAGEQEIPIGLGDNIDGYEEAWDEEDITTHYVLDGVDIESTYRIECWSDNGDLTAYLYTMLKWCMFSARGNMLKSGFKLPKITGTDLEPVPDYIPTFVYRRSLMISFRYENLYFDDEVKRGDGAYHFPLDLTPEDIKVSGEVYYKPHYEDIDI